MTSTGLTSGYLSIIDTWFQFNAKQQFSDSKSHDVDITSNHRQIIVNILGLLPAATKLWPRLCFYSCVWFCSQGACLPRRSPQEGGPPPCLGDPPAKEASPRRRHPPIRGPPIRRPPPKEAPQEGDPQEGGPPKKETPPRRRPPKKETPQEEAPPRRRHPPKEEDSGIRSMSGRYASYWNAFLLKRFSTSSVKCWTANFCDLASYGPDIIMHQLKSLNKCIQEFIFTPHPHLFSDDC